MSLGALWAGAAGVIAAAYPAYLELRRSPPKPAAQTAALPQGDTAYRWYGAASDPVVVCVHGLSTPSIVYHELAEILAQQGFRVLTYDLYGRGASAAPRGLQTPSFFAKQLNALLDHLGVCDGFSLIGYSMGGSIAAHVAAQNPGRLRSLALLASAGMGEELGTMARWAAKWPVIGDWVFHLGYPKHMRDGLRQDQVLGSKAPSIIAQQLAELDRRGFVGSVLSSLRGTLRVSQEQAHRRLAQSALPVTAIWGREDTVIALSALDTLSAWNPIARQVVVDGAGHGLPHSHAAQVAQAVQGDL